MMSSVFRGFLLKIVVIAEASRRLEMMAEDGKHLIADTRARACNKKLGNGAGRFFPNLSDTPRDERRNAVHRNFVPQTNHSAGSWMSTFTKSVTAVTAPINNWKLIVSDNRTGRPEGRLGKSNPGLGPTIVEALAKQLDAMRRSPNG